MKKEIVIICGGFAGINLARSLTSAGDFREEKKVLLSNGELPYDYLVLATGTESNFCLNNCL